MAKHTLPEGSYKSNSENTGSSGTAAEIHATFCFEEDVPIRIWLSERPLSFNAHWHHPLEIIMPVENYYDIEACGCRYHLLPGDILIIPARMVHAVCAPLKGSRYILQFDDSVLSRIQGYSTIRALMTTCLHITRSSHAYIYNDIHHLILQMHNEYAEASEFRSLMIYSDLIRLLLLICSSSNHCHSCPSAPSCPEPSGYHQRFNTLLAYIEQHYTENPTLEAAASHSGFSKYYFTRLFKQYTNCTFYEYLCFRRISAAEELLLHPELSITEVAMLSGFASISTFNRTFKQRKGCTPSEYRSFHTKKQAFRQNGFITEEKCPIDI